MRRRRLLAVLLLAPLLAITSCSAAQIGTVGILRQEDGTLEVLVRLCRGSVDDLWLSAINSFPKGPKGESLSDGWENIEDRRWPLTTPIVDEADVEMPFAEEELGSTALFVLKAAGRDGIANSGYFGAAQLADVRPGEVFARGLEDSGEVYSVVTPEEFEQLADQFCS